MPAETRTRPHHPHPYVLFCYHPLLFLFPDFCGVCGTQHLNPDVLDTYPYCERCQCPLRNPSNLRNRFERLEPRQYLEVLFASYGDEITEKGAVDVTQHVQGVMTAKETQEYLAFGPSINLRKLFGFDPSPEKTKQLRVRYRMDRIFGTLVLDVTSTNRIPLPVTLRRPWGGQRLLKIRRGSYGHPRGATAQGRMCYDVTEILQGLIDLGGGSYFKIDQPTPITPLLGDPAPGYPKELRLEYELRGRSGVEIRNEAHGHLTRPLYLEAKPVISPIIFITSATYGMTPTGRSERLLAINKLLSRADITARKLNAGEVTRKEDRKVLRNKAALLAEKKLLNAAPTSFFEITAKVQQLITHGGMSLMLERESFDCNAVFGNPYAAAPADTTAQSASVFNGGDSTFGTVGGPSAMLGAGAGAGGTSATAPPLQQPQSTSTSIFPPVHTNSTFTSTAYAPAPSTAALPAPTAGCYKLLEINLISVGHDSERLTSSVEASTVGNPLNFITGRPSRFLVPVKDDDFGHGRMAESILFRCSNVTPIIRVNSAAYGNLKDVTRMIDVTPEIQGLVTGRELLLDPQVNLLDLFIRDPCPGQQKQLRVDYTVTGFQGNLRLKVGIRDDRLVAGLELGFPPSVPPDYA